MAALNFAFHWLKRGDGTFPKINIFLEKLLDRKELGGVFPKMLQVGHFPDIHGVVTCPKKNVFLNFFRTVQ